METWPSGLQQKLNVDSFGVKFGNTVARTDMDVGQAKTRSRATDGVDIYTSSINMSFEEYETLRDFYKTTLNNGAKTFAFVNPLSGDTDEFRFMEPPDIKPLGGREFRVNMTWERMP